MLPADSYNVGQFELNLCSPAKFVDPRTVIDPAALPTKVEPSPRSSPTFQSHQTFVPISPVSTEFRFPEDNYQIDSQMSGSTTYNQLNASPAESSPSTFKVPVQISPTTREVAKRTKPKSYETLQFELNLDCLCRS